jgi:GWxTD domain-containing protein
MMSRWLLMAGLTPVLVTGEVPVQQDPGALALSATRFYSARQGTTVEAACTVPFGLLDLVEGGVGGFAAYRVTVVVRDSTGLALTDQSWTQRVPARMRGIFGASAVEQFSFAVPGGRYTVEFAVTDSASGRTTRVSRTVAGFTPPPAASDLLLSTGIRSAADSGLVEGPGEFRRGGFLISAQPVPVLTPSQPMLYYYLELYPGRNVEARLAAHVRTAEGREIIATPAQPVSVHDAGVVATGLNLTGLPPGDYVLHVEFMLPDTTVTRSAPFTMVGFDSEAAISSAFGQSADVFAPLTEHQLDTLYRPLIYLMESSERGIYEGLSVEGKRNYLRQFWTRRDPTPDTPGNEFQDQFYRLIARANQLYREGGAAEVPGWRTDRGRIYVKFGEPDEVLRRPQSGSTKPYEAWKYTRGRPRKFVFYDETGLGNYALIWTNEPTEPSRANWVDLLGVEGVQDVERF